MLSNNDLEKVSKLAKIAIKNEEKEEFLNKLNLVFNWVEQLSKIDVSNVEINNLAEMDDTPERADKVSENNTVEELLSNTKHKNFNMFCVPKIVE